MDTSLIIAKVLIPIFGVVTISLFISPGMYKTILKEMGKSMTLIYLGSLVSLLIGSVIVTFHNVWSNDWTLLITILGRLSLVKGALLILCPKCMSSWMTKANRENGALYLSGAIYGLITLVFIYFAFVV